ncbi:MAG: hypothetical protein PHT84_00065 [Candidatus Pacebacteria bacterium]|nr:hypothetical protein [Candidatus Paceibacterota bacterium]
MPLPLFLGAFAFGAGALGIGNSVKGFQKMKGANDNIKAAERRYRESISKFEKVSGSTNKKMDELGALELRILKDFEVFSDTMEKIQNRPVFKEYNKDGVTLPQYDRETLKKVSVGASALLGGLGGAAAGTAGGFAAAGATTSAVMALGTASTGTALASLSGAALTNATFAAIGGGAIAAGGGGIALGTAILGATTFGVGILVGALIFNATAGKLSEKSDEAYAQMVYAEKTISKACQYLKELEDTASNYIKALEAVYNKYSETFGYVSYIVNNQKKVQWDEFSEEEKLATQNAILFVGLLYKMCQVSLVKKADNDNEINKINHREIKETLLESKSILNEVNNASDNKEKESKLQRNFIEVLKILNLYDDHSFEQIDKGIETISKFYEKSISYIENDLKMAEKAKVKIELASSMGGAFYKRYVAYLFAGAVSISEYNALSEYMQESITDAAKIFMNL